MVTEPTKFEKKLHKLELMRRDIGIKLDRSYLQNNISELLALEEKYAAVIYQISRIRSLLAQKKRTTAM